MKSYNSEHSKIGSNKDVDDALLSYESLEQLRGKLLISFVFR